MDLKAFIQKRSKPNDVGCWIWQLSIMGRGYGQAWVAKRFQGAHRVSYRAYHGEIPPGLVVCHSCDVKRCVNPDHLFLGTYRENSHDMIRKDRAARGGNGKEKKLTPNKARMIGVLRKRGLSFKAIGNRFGVCPQTVSDVVWGNIWKRETTYREIPRGKEILTEKDVLEIRKIYSSGQKSLNEIRRDFGVGYGTVQAIVSRRTWKHVP